MGQSHIKRRSRERPIKLHRSRVERELQRVCEDLGAQPPEDQRRSLVDEVVRLASPFVYRGLDAVIPADRTDLMRAWFVHRLVGTASTPAEIERMARRFAPAPDRDFAPGRRFFGDPSSGEVAAAWSSRYRRRARRQEALIRNA